jgi:carboxyl-terminal processing protease
LVGTGVGSFFVGRLYPKTIVVKGVDNVESGVIQNVNFGVFWDVWQRVKDNYLKSQDIKDQEIIYGAVKGLVGSLNDPYSVFLPPDDAKKFNDDLGGSFSGIGAEIGIRNDILTIIAPLKNSPAEKAGLRAADKILKIGDKASDGMTINEAVKLIRGPEGMEVLFTILRNGDEKTKEIKVIRGVIDIPTVDWKDVGDDIVHLQLFNFNENVGSLFLKTIKEIQEKAPNTAGFIFDLRNNPGGFLEAAVNISSWFLPPDSLTVTEEFRSDKKTEFKTSGNGVLKDFPLVILINQGSASASEIVAGALRDARGIKLVGEKSFGKETVQELQQLSDGSSLKITIAHWRLPKGDLIDKNGIKPDFEIKPTEKEIEAGKDPQLEKAKEVLKSEIFKPILKS